MVNFYPRNILVHPKSGRLLGIVDWETAGFFPEWWEYMRTLDRCDVGRWSQLGAWRTGMMKSYDRETTAYGLLQDYVGGFM